MSVTDIPYPFKSVAVITTLDRMVRWEPGAPERLQKAALELFATRGFEQTTATEIAQSVGLTERTFFRHFSDKREVLFYGQHLLVQAFLAGVDTAPPGASPIEIVASALQSAASFFPDERRPYSRTRQSDGRRRPPRARRRRTRGHPGGGVRRHRVRDRVHTMDSRGRAAISRRHRSGRAPRTADPDRKGDGVTQDPVITPTGNHKSPFAHPRH
jgi:AcrR family transcriptional regulator